MSALPRYALAATLRCRVACVSQRLQLRLGAAAAVAEQAAERPKSFRTRSVCRRDCAQTQHLRPRPRASSPLRCLQLSKQRWQDQTTPNARRRTTPSLQPCVSSASAAYISGDPASRFCALLRIVASLGNGCVRMLLGFCTSAAGFSFCLADMPVAVAVLLDRHVPAAATSAANAVQRITAAAAAAVAACA